MEPKTIALAISNLISRKSSPFGTLDMINDYQPRKITLSVKKVGLLAAYKLNKIPWPQKAEVATAPAPPPKDYR